MTPATQRIRTTKLAMTLVDLSGYAQAVEHRSALEIATFLDAFYVLSAGITGRHGGRVVKTIGDASLAVFPEDACLAAVDSIAEIQAAVPALAKEHGLSVGSGANVHLATVAEGEKLGPEGGRRYDIAGQGVNHLFLMGRGAGCRISEPVYRQLPSDRRAPWTKHKPPATYQLT